MKRCVDYNVLIMIICLLLLIFTPEQEVDLFKCFLFVPSSSNMSVMNGRLQADWIAKLLTILTTWRALSAQEIEACTHQPFILKKGN